MKFKCQISKSGSPKLSGTIGLQLRKVKGGVYPWTDRTSIREQKIISRLRTGHARFAYNFGRGNFRKRCESCHVHNSVEHVLCVCPQYSYPRETYGISGSIRDTLADDAGILEALICFLKDAELYYDIWCTYSNQWNRLKCTPRPFSKAIVCVCLQQESSSSSTTGRSEHLYSRSLVPRLWLY